MSEPGEFELIRRLKEEFGVSSSGVVEGMGDDAAVISPTKGMQLLFTADALVEGVHFQRAITPFTLGRKALAVNLSDIAAMGGRPKFYLTALAVPSSVGADWIEKFTRGAEPLAKEHSVCLVGGDVSSSVEKIFISITLVGEVEPGGAILRSNAETGDSIFVTGRLGDSGAGLELTLAGGPVKGDGEILIRRHQGPEPRVKCGRFLSQNHLASAAIDLSDGLSSDLRHLCAASDVGALIYEERLPLSRELAACEADLKYRPALYALNGGEDYELLFTVPPEKKERLIKEWPSSLAGLTEIGKIVTEQEGIIIKEADGKERPLLPCGFDHFKGR